MAFAAVLLASNAAAAQGVGEGAEPSSESSSVGWSLQPGERHIVGRVQGGVGLRVFDPWGAGALAPGWIHAQGAYLFVRGGPFVMGPSLGAQVGLDVGHSAPQFTAQPGWLMRARFSQRWGLLLRADIPILVTRGANVDRPEFRVQDPPNDAMGNPPAVRRADVRAPFERPYTAAFGIEVGGAGAFYLTSGIALTAELNAGMYFGDSFFSYPVIGVGLGALIDYELIP